MSKIASNPKVSVILPNYNHARFLEERIQSILDQEFQDFELLLLDDKSRDESVKVLESYRDHEKVTQFVINEQNSGTTFKQWKKGLELAKGEYIWIAESDDSCSPQLLSRAMKALQANPEVHVHYCQSIMTEENGDFKRDNKVWTDDLDEDLWGQDFVMNGKEFLSKYLLQKNVIPNASGAVFKRNSALKWIDEPTPYKFCGDWLFWSLMLSDSSISYSAERDNRFRYLDQSTRVRTSDDQKRRRILEECKVLARVVQECPEVMDSVKERVPDLLKRWTALHSTAALLRKHFYLILNEPIIDMSRAELATMLLKK